MTRQKYTNSNLGAFSDWHRTNLHSCYRFIDIDYFGYQLVRGRYEPYIAIERIRLTQDPPRVGPSNYPLDEHKRHVYEKMANELGIPAYTMWHNDKCETFMIARIDRNEPIRRIEGKHELMDFLDEVCKKQFGGLGYR